MRTAGSVCRLAWTLVAAAAALQPFPASAQAIPSRSPPVQGGGDRWRAWLDTPGGQLPFGLELATDGGPAFLLNGPERIELPVVAWDGTQLTLDLPHYDARIEARREGDTLAGSWEKQRGMAERARVPFGARRGFPHRFPRRARAVLPKNVAGRWAVTFASDDLPAAAVFEQAVGRPGVTGTFLTATGDYRYLAGSVDGAELRLSCFDGAHAFLFRARIGPDGDLEGDFWSGNWFHDSWTARRDEQARPPDAFAQTSWEDGVSLADLAFPDLSGTLRSLDDPAFAGRARLLQVFGTWCPNCHDETAYLVELAERYGRRGLSIVGLAFELTDDFERNARQVQAFRRRHAVPYPILLAGSADKARATQDLGALDRVRAFPTTIFLDGAGRVLAVHSGFAGPATGEAHTRLRAKFEAILEPLLDPPDP